jgi:hypothetical protein
MAMKKNQAQFTFHSLTRASEMGISVKELIDGWNRASGYDLPKKEFGWKFWKYGVDMADDHYLYDQRSGLLFTLVDKKVFSLVITITKKEMKGKYASTHSK